MIDVERKKRSSCCQQEQKYLNINLTSGLYKSRRIFNTSMIAVYQRRVKRRRGAARKGVGRRGTVLAIYIIAHIGD